MKPIEHLIIVFICSGIIIYHSIISKDILDHPYMIAMIIGLLFVSLYHIVLMASKVFKPKK